MGESQTPKRLACLALNPAAISEPECANQGPRPTLFLEPYCDASTPPRTCTCEMIHHVPPVRRTAGQGKNPTGLHQASPCRLPAARRMMFPIGRPGIAWRAKRRDAQPDADPSPGPEQAVGARGPGIDPPNRVLAELENQVLG